MEYNNYTNDNYEDNNYINDEYLQKIFIGEKYEQIVNQKFSIWSLLFGGLYFAYRKMLIIGILANVLTYVISIIIDVIAENSAVTALLFGIAELAFWGIIFKKIYMFWVNKKIEKIKSKSSDENEIIQECRIQGGTSVAYIVIVMIIASLITGAIGAKIAEIEKAKLQKEYEEKINDYYNEVLNPKFEYENGYNGIMHFNSEIKLDEHINVTIPSELNKGYSNEDYCYNYESEGGLSDSFEVTIHVADNGGYYKTSEAFIKDIQKYRGQEAQVSKMLISNIEWDICISEGIFDGTTKYECMTKHGDDIYLIEFVLNLENMQHVNWTNGIIDSFEFID